MKPSIRRSLAVGTTVTSVLVLLAAGMLLYRQARNALHGEFDRGLLKTGRIIASLPEMTPEGLEFEFDPLTLVESGAPGGGYLTLASEDGRVLYRTPDLEGRDLPVPGHPAETPAFFSFKLDGEPLRAVLIRFQPRVEDEKEAAGPPEGEEPITPLSGENSRLTLVLAQNSGPVEAFLGRLRWMLGFLGAATGVTLVLLLGVVAGRALRPLDVLAGEIERIEEPLKKEITLGRTPVEIQPVVDRLNQLMARLDAAIVRERTFSADMAHELRTPLAGLRTLAEVTLSRDRNREEYREALNEILSIVTQTASMTERLLYLARLESGEVTPSVEPASLEAIVKTSLQPQQEAIAAARLEVMEDLPPGATIRTDGRLLAVAIRNLVENAVTHAEPGSRVEIRAAAANGSWRFEVANSGSSIDQAQVPGLLERFSRGDASRSFTGTHFGLGLPLVRRITELLGVRMEIRAVRGGEFRVSLSGGRNGDTGREIR